MHERRIPGAKAKEEIKNLPEHKKSRKSAEILLYGLTMKCVNLN